MRFPKLTTIIYDDKFIITYQQIKYDNRYFMIYLNSSAKEPVVKISQMYYKKFFEPIISTFRINPTYWKKFLDKVERYNKWLDECND